MFGIRRHLVWLGILMLAVLLFGCTRAKQGEGKEGTPPGAKDNVIKLGFVGPLSGAVATFGTGAKQGTEFAVEKLNAAGGINGKRVEVTYLDDKGNPQESALAVQRLIDGEKVVAIVGGSTSTGTLAIKDIVHQAKIPVVAPYATDPRITGEGNRYIFVNAANNVLLGSQIARYAVEDLGYKKLAVMVRDDDYGRSIAEAFKKKAEELGAKVIAEEHYATDAKEFKSLLFKIQKSNPEALLLSGYYNDSGLIAKQARELGIQAKLLGTNPLMSPGYIEVGGLATEGTVMTALYLPDTAADFGGQVAADFVKAWEQKYGSAPNIYAAHAYDAVNLFKLAIERAGSTSGDAVRAELAKIANYQGVTGPTTFTESGAAVKPVLIVEIKDGKLKYVKAFAAQ